MSPKLTIEELEELAHDLNLRNKILKMLCNEAVSIIAKHPNEAFVRRWFADYKAATAPVDTRQGQ